MSARNGSRARGARGLAGRIGVPGKVVRSGVRRRKVQTLVMVLATMMAVTVSVLGGSLVVASRQPFQQAF
ncbi:MAG TPA: hypothetical protein VGL02_14685, partial [Streptomyces sp.]